MMCMLHGFAQRKGKRMVITALDIKGAFLIERKPNRDERGYFARLYCENEFRESGICMPIRQINLCENKEKGTLRGLHLQKGRHAEDKVVSCTRGRIYDVCADVREDSPTYLKYCAYELSEDNGRMLFIPKGCAHGYVTLEEDSQLLYLMSEFYVSEDAGGYRYDDPALGIAWPITENLVMSHKDRELPYVSCSEEV